MASTKPLTCANGPHLAEGPLYNISQNGSEPRLVCHGCWTLGGLLDQQRKADALDVLSGLVKTKRERRGKPQRPRGMWKP